MLTYNETEIIFSVGGYSSKTSSFQYGGLNPNWTSSRLPTSACLEPSAKLAQTLVLTIKPHLTITSIKPYDLNDEMPVDDNHTPLQKTKKPSRSKTVCINPLPSTKDIPTLDDDNMMSSSDSDVEIEEQATRPVPKVSIQEQGDDEFDKYSPEERGQAHSKKRLKNRR